MNQFYNNEYAAEWFAYSKEVLWWNAQQVSEKEVIRLRALLNFADWRYYVLDDPFLADVEYDQILSLLKEVESIHPEWITLDSPTHRVPSDITTSWSTVPHKVPMLSLDNSYNAQDLLNWHQRNVQALNQTDIEYTVEPKYDGAGISLLYEKDYLTLGATRGNGIEGEMITKNLRQIKSIPLKSPIHLLGISEMEIRGEVLIPLSKFEELNDNRLKEGQTVLANPRNAASGSLRMLDPKEVRKRKLKALCYHVSYIKPIEGVHSSPVLGSHFDTIKWLNSHGFSTPEDTIKKFTTIEEVVSYCEQFELKRDELDYEVDGMVIKVDQLIQQNKLGSTAHHPRWAMAYKFQARQATSTLDKVEFQVGRTGAITPVAKISPVQISGVTVSSVSLFNEDNLIEKDLKIGDKVLVERAGDVIPYIVKSFVEMRVGTERTIEFPTQCPECQETLVKEAEEVAWRCINVSCPAQVVEHLIHFASKNALDIKHLGQANIKKFYDQGWLNKLVDIYRLDFDKIADLEGFGSKSVDNLKEAIEVSKHQALHRLLFGLGIRFVGEKTAKTLANAVDDIIHLKDWTLEQLMELQDIGPKVAQSVVLFFKNEENLEMLYEFKKYGLILNHVRADLAEDLPLKDKTFVFTGTLHQLKRKEAQEMVEKLGAKNLNSVSQQLDYLVVGDKAGSKLKKAQELGNIQIMNEEEFLTWISQYN